MILYDFITALYNFINASEYFFNPYFDIIFSFSFLFLFKSSKHLIEIKYNIKIRVAFPR